MTVKGTTTLNVRALPLSASKLVKTIPYGQTFSVTGYANIWNKSWLKIADGYVYRAYVEAGNPYKEPITDVKRGTIGEGAKWTQWLLGKRGYKGLNGRVLGCDGNFGPNSEYALLTLQREHGLKVDGICGAATREKLRG
jgi:peptidoglycan hydrolase-like protein with peptidoglycan-binding domain